MVISISIFPLEISTSVPPSLGSSGFAASCEAYYCFFWFSSYICMVLSILF